MISDFGVAIVSQSRDPLQTEPYEFAGTVIYAAPEQLQGIPCKSSDQYALGVVSYEWFCGDRPFSGNFDEIVHQHLYVPPLPLRLKNPQLSSAIEQVVMKTLAKKVEARFPSAQAFAEALEWAVEQSPTKLKPKRQFLSPQPFFDDTVAKS
jgi:serine/threonine-protein kinase